MMERIEAPARPVCVRAIQARATDIGAGLDIRTQNSDVTEITLFDEIGFFGITAAEFHRRLAEVATPRIRLAINSPGGDVFDGITMFNDLVDHAARVEVAIQGIAASAASVVAMAGDTIEIADNAFVMVHNAWGLAIGDRNDMAAFAGILEQIDGALARTYAARAGMDVDEAAAMMDAETWFDGPAAVEAGFADATSEAGARALCDPTRFRNAPAALKREIEAALRDAGWSLKQARTAVAQGFESADLRDAGRLAARPRDAGEAEQIAGEIARLADRMYAAA